PTVANAMDVGNPSNFARILEIFNHDHGSVKGKLIGHTFGDPEIKQCISEVFKKTGYVLDPHGACGYLGLRKSLAAKETGIFLGTAHPAKFSETVGESIGRAIAMPVGLKKIMEKEKVAARCPPTLEGLKHAMVKALGK
nr:threonine synthase [Cyclobacteriaceae bacterium]